MPAIAFPKSALGAIVNVALLPDSRHRLAVQSLLNPPAEVHLRMLLDTGADNTCIDGQHIDAAWKVVPHAFYLSQSMGSLNRVPVFHLELKIMSGPNATVPFWVHDPLRITCRGNNPFVGLPYAGVIGRDVLDRGLLIYDGINGHCTLVY